jgi:hypothetical protein
MSVSPWSTVNDVIVACLSGAIQKYLVGRCRLTVSKPVFKAHMDSTLERMI